MRLESVIIPGRTVPISGLRYGPHGHHSTVVIYTHGFTSGKYSMDGLASYLAGRGFTGITFDLIGHKLGATGAAMDRTEQAAENVQDVLHWVREHHTGRRIVLVGHSMGAAASIQAASLETDEGNSDDIAGVAALCMGLGPAKGFESIIGKAMLKQRSDYVEGAPALELLGGLNAMVQSAANLADLPTLFIAANQDVLVPVSSVESLAALAGPKATTLKIDSSHLDCPDRARTAILDWITRLG